LKRAVKRVLHGVGLLEWAERAYFNLNSASLDVFWRELRYVREGEADGVPLPPPGLVFDVIACRWRAVYLDSGERIVESMVGTLRRAGVEPMRLESILDFGCGCGRLIRQVRKHTDAALLGCDYNARLANWCLVNLPFGTFTTNTLAPPLPYDDASFDYVYARSVFTHLDHDLQHAWIAEMRRIIKPGGWLYVTMHGEQLAARLAPPDREIFDAGGLVVAYPMLEGENLCSTYANREWVCAAFGDVFDLVAFEPGREEQHLRQDVYLFAVSA
jgi:SAM-dependent methyltransferase